MRQYLIAGLLGLAVLGVAGCSSDEAKPPAAGTTTAASQTPATPTSATPTVDPYAAYLAKAPKGEKTLSREDAALRAKLGCGKSWPPGTVDAVLAEAYAAFCP